MAAPKANDCKMLALEDGTRCSWKLGLIQGKDDVSAEARTLFEAEGIHTWMTQHRLDHLVVPFLRRGGAGGLGAAKERKACISLRTLQEFQAHVSHQWALHFPIICAPMETGGTPILPVRGAHSQYVWVSVEQFYRRMMDKYHRQNVDTVRRGARSYICDSSGELYETTLAQLTLLYEAWRAGIIYYCVLLRNDITREIQSAHCQRRKRRTLGKTVSVPILSTDTVVPPMFVDVDQFHILVDPPSPEKCRAILRANDLFTDDWRKAADFLPGKTLLGDTDQVSLARERVRAAQEDLRGEARSRGRGQPTKLTPKEAYAKLLALRRQRESEDDTPRRRVKARISHVPIAAATFHLSVVGDRPHAALPLKGKQAQVATKAETTTPGSCDVSEGASGTPQELSFCSDDEL